MKVLHKYKKLPIQIRASLWFLICSFLQKGVSMITTPIFTRIMTSYEFGEFNVFNSWMNIITVFVTLNLYYGVFTKGLVQNENDKERYASALQGLCTFCVLIGVFVYFISHNFWNNIFKLTTTQMVLMFSTIWTTSIFRFWSGYQRVELQYRELVTVTLISSVAKPVVGIFFVLSSEDKVTARILAIALVELISYIGLYVSQMKRGRYFYVKHYWKHAINFNLPLIPHYLSQTVLNSSDRIMIKNMVGSQEAGIYSLAYSVSQIMIIFNNALIKTIEPWIYKKIKAGRVNEIGKVTYLSLILVAVVNLILIAFAPEAVYIFAPTEYHMAIWIIPPVAMGVYFMFSYIFFAAIEFYFEKNHYITYATMFGAVLNIILNYICIKLFGYLAAGYTTLVCYIIYSVMHYSFSKKICNEEMNGVRIYELRKLLIITGVFLIIGFILMFTYNYPLVRYGLIFSSGIFMIIKRKGIILILKELVSLKKV